MEKKIKQDVGSEKLNYQTNILESITNELENAED